MERVENKSVYNENEEEIDIDNIDDLIENVMWKNLNVDELLNFCLVSKKYRRICENNTTWKYLLKRDYDYIYNEKNAKEKYFQIKYGIDNFWKLLRIIRKKFTVQQIVSPLSNIDTFLRTYILEYVDPLTLESIYDGYVYIVRFLTNILHQLKPYIENRLSITISKYNMVNFARFLILLGEDNYINFLQDPVLNFSQNIHNYTINNSLNNSPLIFDKIKYY